MFKWIVLFSACLQLFSVERRYPTSAMSKKFYIESSYPMITGSIFRAICDHWTDEPEFDPTQVKDGDIIWCPDTKRGQFIREHLSKIRARFILVSHLTVRSMPPSNSKILKSPYLVAWFSKNAKLDHPKMRQLPIGLAPWKIRPYHAKHFFQLKREKNSNRPTLAYLNYSSATKKAIREPIEKAFQEMPWVKTSPRVQFGEYLHHMYQSKFILSPPGCGVDCYRHWESLYMGAVPIIQSTFLDPMYRDLPVLIVSDWNSISEGFLNKAWNDIWKKSHNWNKLNPDYWLKTILDEKRKIVKDLPPYPYDLIANPYLDVDFKYPASTTELKKANLEKALAWGGETNTQTLIQFGSEGAGIVAMSLPFNGRLFVVDKWTYEEKQKFLSAAIVLQMAQKIVPIDSKQVNLLKKIAPKVDALVISNSIFAHEKQNLIRYYTEEKSAQLFQLSDIQ
ncbi:MAG: hypothetical protein MRY21_02840 [Simkaniaceae bacterium]|nr:hypothetical protein [Simkaniaceae bacterium]